MINVNREMVEKAEYLINDLFDGNIDTFEKIYKLAEKELKIVSNDIEIIFNQRFITFESITVRNSINGFSFYIRKSNENIVIVNESIDWIWEQNNGIMKYDFKFMKEMAYCLDALHELLYWSK